MMIWVRRHRPDLIAVAVLIFLCAFFFWRLYTPSLPDQLSISQGDFSSQYYNFSAYQARRFAQGTLIPLWNPDNFAGSPFLADPQSAAAYPVRWLFLLLFRGNWSYSALELEVVAHFLITSLLTYAFVRRVTGQVVAGLVAAVAFSYGGYLNSFPIQQVSILESGTWLPLVLLGIHQATRRSSRFWFVLAGVGMALMALAGHPQIALMCGYLAAAYLAYRRRSWREFMIGALIFGVVGIGLAAVMLLPTAEFQLLTTRGGTFNYVGKAGGFPFSDVTQILWSTMSNLYAPMYIGVLGIVLAAFAVLFKGQDSEARETRFWVAAGIVALLLSFGGKTALFQFAYTLVPGASLFRDQERAVLLWSFALAVLAGLGAAVVLSDRLNNARVRAGLWIFAGFTALFVVVLRMIPGVADSVLQVATYTAIVSALAVAALFWVIQRPAQRQMLLVAVLVLDLFSVSQGGVAYTALPAATLLPEPAWLTDLHPQLAADPFARFDDLDRVPGPFGSLYDVPTIRGTSPLRLQGIQQILGLPTPKYWDLLAVRYVATEDSTLADSLSAAKLRDIHDWSGDYALYELPDPRPLATLIYAADLVAEGDAIAVMAAPDYDLRQRAVITQPLALDLGGERPADAKVDLIAIQPERLELSATTSAPALLLISIPYHPGWQATVNGEAVTLVRADVGLMALPLASGQSAVTLEYTPRSFQVGAALSLLTVGIVILTGAFALLRPRLSRRNS